MKRRLIPFAALLITCVSLSALYGTIYPDNPWKSDSVFLRQGLWIVLGWLAFFIFSNFYYRRLINFVYPFYALVIISLVLVLFLGGARLGAQRWIKLWWFNFQPSEFAKLAVILVFSLYFSRKGLGDIRLDTRSLSFFKGLVLPFLIIAVPFGLILKQPDLGTALLLVFIFLGVVYFSGVKTRYITLVLVLGIAFSPLAWNHLKGYQKDRIAVFLNPDSDPLGAGYTIIQSKIAIGSGRLWGKGWLSGTQGQLNFLPEAHTDFIFGIVAEEIGFLGCVFLILLYYLIIRQGLFISANCDDNFGKLISFAISIMLAFQVYVNISMTMGLSPVVGVPLPLLSYGGSSMLMNFICLGILRNIEKRG